MNRLSEIDKRMNELNEIANTTEFKEPSVKRRVFEEIILLKEEENRLRPLKFKEKQKIKLIKSVLKSIEDMEILKIKSITKYEKVRSKMKKKLLSFVSKKGKVNHTKIGEFKDD